MAKSLSASSKVMKNYLSELLTEESAAVIEEPAQEKQKLERLLQKVTVTEPKVEEKVVNTKTELAEKQFTARKTIEQELVHQDDAPLITAKAQGGIAVDKKVYRDGDFQAMFFEVAGLLIAVPLIELGGIHNVDKTTSLMGKPPWFKGVMVHRDEKINVVDTALWVMPEKCDQKLKNSLNYQYIIMLSNSNWGLSAEKLVDTVVLKQQDVKWLDSPRKRPWLAGLVKDRMCALLDVDSLIRLLDEGMDNK